MNGLLASADGDTTVIGESGSGIVDRSAESAFPRETGQPKPITSLHPFGLGDRGKRGIGHFAQEGMLKRIICGHPGAHGVQAKDTATNYRETYARLFKPEPMRLVADLAQKSPLPRSERGAAPIGASLRHPA